MSPHREAWSDSADWTSAPLEAPTDLALVNAFLQQTTGGLEPTLSSADDAKPSLSGVWGEPTNFSLFPEASFGLKAPSLEPQASTSSTYGTMDGYLDGFSGSSFSSATPPFREPSFSGVDFLGIQENDRIWGSTEASHDPLDLETLLALPRADAGPRMQLDEDPFNTGQYSLDAGTHHEDDPTQKYVTDEQRWAAYCAKDVESDGKFVLVVTSTKCICRTLCPSRRPLRKNVIFFDSVADAQAANAGYRPCKRCKPVADRDPTLQRQEEAVTAACQAIQEAMNNGKAPPPLEELAKHAGMSVFHFHRIFKAKMGTTPKKWAKDLE